MIDWKLPADLQGKYEEVLATNSRLQKELGIVPMSIEQRHQAYLDRKKSEADLKKAIGQRRPLPRWKV